MINAVNTGKALQIDKDHLSYDINHMLWMDIIWYGPYDMNYAMYKLSKGKNQNMKIILGINDRNKNHNRHMICWPRLKKSLSQVRDPQESSLLCQLHSTLSRDTQFWLTTSTACLINLFRPNWTTETSRSDSCTL